MTRTHLASIPILDHHCHSLLRNGEQLTTAAFQAFFTESDDPVIHTKHVQHTVYFRWAVKELAAFFGCAPQVEAVLAAHSVRLRTGVEVTSGHIGVNDGSDGYAAYPFIRCKSVDTEFQNNILMSISSSSPRSQPRV